jgi:exosortase
MGKIVHNWEHTPVYSHGYLIPVFAIGLLWYRRDRLKPGECSPSWWGLSLLAVAAMLRLLGARYYLEWFDYVSILPMLAGTCLLIGGTHALRWAAPAIAFLVFMLPLPYRVEVGLRTPLQKVGTIASCYLLQTLGLPAYAEGNQIHGITERPLGVEEACSGLGMMMVFFALTVAVVYLVSHRPLWERLLVLLSAAPIAVISNVLRISATGLLYAWGFDRAAEVLHEQLSAFLMMPVALGLLWLELWFFSKVMVAEDVQPLSAHLMFQHVKTSSEQNLPVTTGS